jgi:L-asparaginase/Glu-tRNA(Gln) amidotransferase subunit D
MSGLVYVFLTGGTIVTRLDSSIRAAVMDSHPEMLLKRTVVPGVHVEVRELMRKGSPDVAPSDWSLLAREVLAASDAGASASSSFMGRIHCTTPRPH